MKISELPKEIREKALEYQKNETNPNFDKNTDDLSEAFFWGYTDEGIDYWAEWSVKYSSQEPLKTLEELQPLILEWARERGINNKENQRLKLLEECGEFANAILKNDIEKQKDGIGDIFVVLIILGELMEIELELNLDEFDISEINNLSHYMFDNILCFHNFEYPYIISILNDVAIHLNLDLTECANLAWNEIKDRTGKTVNGTFIKD